MKQIWIIAGVIAAGIAVTVWAESEHHGGGSGGDTGSDWVHVNSTTGSNQLANGTPLPASLTPGQFLRGSRTGDWQERRQWRPPHDILRAWTGGIGRVTFSHERHFAALKGKQCAMCHDGKLGLGRATTRTSFAPTGTTDSHKETSLGRFCSNCHRPDSKLKPFTALGTPDAPTCRRCHAPADHGLDFTRGHHDRAEHGAAHCAQCHNGANAVLSPAAREQARQFRAAQLELAQNKGGPDAFAKTLPNVFCAYCHGTDERWHAGRGDD